MIKDPDQTKQGIGERNMLQDIPPDLYFTLSGILFTIGVIGAIVVLAQHLLKR